VQQVPENEVQGRRPHAEHSAMHVPEICIILSSDDEVRALLNVYNTVGFLRTF
jgi:hypothetical protein